MLKRKLFTGHASYLLVAETMLEAGNTNWKSMESTSLYFDVILDNNSMKSLR